MTKEEIEKAVNHYLPIVKDKPISKDWPKHLIVSFEIEETAPEYYQLWVVGYSERHKSSYKKLLNNWLSDNGY